MCEKMSNAGKVEKDIEIEMCWFEMYNVLLQPVCLASFTVRPNVGSILSVRVAQVLS